MSLGVLTWREFKRLYHFRSAINLHLLTLSICRSGSGQPFASEFQIYPPDLVHKAVGRFTTEIVLQTFVPYKFHPRRAQFEPKLEEERVYIEELVIKEHAWQEHTTMSREAYSITVSQVGKTVIHALSPEGILRALDTLTQLFYAHSKTDEVYTPFAPVSIRDAPIFEHRGLNLDISRNWIPPEDVLRTIDAMALNKLNKLHLHCTDAQSWPLEVPAIPSLAIEGAYREDQIWSVRDLHQVQHYGLYHGVEVYLEIDLPEHTASIHHSHPQLITAYNQPWATYACQPPTGQLKLNSPDVPLFLTTLLDDLLPRSASFSGHFHVGGDELNREAYNLDSAVASSSKEVIRPHLQRLMDHVLSLVQSHGLTSVMWEDMLLEWDLQLPASTIIQTWRSSASLASVVAKGYRALFGPCQDWYLDCGYGTTIDPDPANPDTPIKKPFRDWCSPYKNWRQMLSYDPLKDIPEGQRHLVIGGECHLWGELTDSVNLDNMLWPRVAAAAEVLWKGKGEVGEGTTRRLAEMRERLVAGGVRAGMVQMEWGLRNEGTCIL
jgi:hexosaminidase